MLERPGQNQSTGHVWPTGHCLQVLLNLLPLTVRPLFTLSKPAGHPEFSVLNCFSGFILCILGVLFFFAPSLSLNPLDYCIAKSHEPLKGAFWNKKGRSAITWLQLPFFPVLPGPHIRTSLQVSDD